MHKLRLKLVGFSRRRLAVENSGLNRSRGGVLKRELEEVDGEVGGVLEG
jgi:hypothetical protein